MVRPAIALVLIALTAPVAAQRVNASLKTPPPAFQLFDRDWVLMNWALKHFDANHDILLQPDEAQAAAEAFRKLADTNGDGRVTPQEYRDARARILAQD